MRILATTLATTLAATVCLSPAALADAGMVTQAIQTVCGDRGVIVEKLESAYREKQTAVGVLGPDVMMEIFVSDNGTWTIISTDTGGQSCVISAGEGWDSTFLASLPQA